MNRRFPDTVVFSGLLGGGAAGDDAGDVGEPAPDHDPLTGVVRAEDFDPSLALIAGCSVQHMSHSCRLSRCLTSHLPTTLQQMMHTGCLRSGGDTRPVLIVGLW